MPTQRTEGEASRLLHEYEQLNSDLPKSTRRQLAMFVLATQVGKESLDALFGRPLGPTPFKHRSWFWYNALRTSGLEPYWDDLAATRNSGVSFKQCLYTLRDQASKESWELLSKRAATAIFRGTDELKPWWWHDRDSEKPRLRFWTKGGTWDRRFNYTKPIILNEPIERDTYDFNEISRLLGPESCRRIEIELHDVVDENELLYPDALNRAVAYVRERIPQILGRERSTWYRTISWFFQEPVKVPGSEGFAIWHNYMWETIRLNIGWEWLPDEPDSKED